MKILILLLPLLTTACTCTNFFQVISHDSCLYEKQDYSNHKEQVK